MQIIPYLNFNGQCEAAFKFYEQVLGGKITFMATFGESPAAPQVGPESHHLIMHATLAIGDQALMACDDPSGRHEKPTGIHLSLHFKDKAEGERIFNALAENGTVQMPFQPTFWAAGFGTCVDRFGIPWIINCDQAG